MYLDPGLASLAIQVILGFLLAVPVTLVVFRRKVVSFFKRNRESSGRKDS